jgi:hypothetical protein
VRTTFFLLVCLFSVSLVFGQNQKPVFDPSKLSKEDLENCQKFKEKKGKVRWDEFQKIKHIFPTCKYTITISPDRSKKFYNYEKGTVTMIMTKEQLFKLIGEPDADVSGYYLGIKQGECEVYFQLLKNNQVIEFHYLNCKDSDKL